MARSRKEIDKEAMFKKVMPSSDKPLPPTADTADAPPPVPQATPEDDLQAAPPPIQVALPEEPPQHGIGAINSVIDVHKEVHLSHPEPAALINLMEHVVAERLDAAIDKFRCCKCDKCKKDVAAIALNRLKPRYVVRDSASSPEDARQTSAEVATALVQAILMVKAHPRH